MTTDLVTIGITCFNAADTIARALDSALAQSWPSIEILVVDDASFDESPEILETYAAKNPSITVIRNANNRGVSYNRQLIVDTAKGRYIAYFDDDDWSFPARVEKQVARIQGYAAQIGHEKIFCYGDRVLIKGGQNEIVLHGIGRTEKAPRGIMVADMILADINTPGYAWGLMGSGTMLAPVGLIKTLGGFDKTFRRSAEVELAIRAAMKDVAFISVAEPVIKQYYTATPDKSLWNMGRYHLKMVSKHWRLILARGHAFRAFYPFTRFMKKKMGGRES